MTSLIDLPKRPRFSWDIRSVPWTDGRGNQEDYVSAVRSWSAFHAKLPDSNGNKIPKGLRGIMLHSHLYGRAKDLCKEIPFDEIASEEGIDKICKALYKKDALTVVSNAYSDFQKLLSTKRGNNESFRNFESRFAAAIAKMKSHSSKTLPESLTAFMLLSNSNVDANQRISILSSATSHSAQSASTLTNEQLMDSVTYDPIASVLRQCDSNTTFSTDKLHANLSSFPRPRWNRNQRTPQQIAELKKKSRCKTCGLWGHWHSDHTPDGTLKPGVKASKTPLTQSFRETRTFSSKPPTPKKTMTFNMAKFNDTSNSFPCHFIGPLLDDGAPYSGLGLVELKMLSPYLRTNPIDKLDPLPPAIADRTHWQYGSGSHSSESRRMLGSIIISAKLNDETMINIRHIVIEGSSQWLIGRNVTTKCDIIHTSGNYLKLSDHSKIPLKNVDMHSYVPSYIFLKGPNKSCSNYQAKLFCATGNIHDPTIQLPWSELKKIIDKVHKHVCGHASLSDMQILLQRNNMWSFEVEKYLNRVVSSCTDCARTHEPKQARKVSLSSINRSFNKVVCIDHFHLGKHRICHIMDSTTRYSAGAVVNDTAMEAAIGVIDSHWISPFWTPEFIQFDQAFANKEFNDYLSLHGINPRPIPARRHNKNVIESKHKIIRDIFLRITSYNDGLSDIIGAQQAIRISNDLYGNDTCSAHELAKGFTRPIIPGTLPKIVPKDLVMARETLMAKRKLNLILRSKSTTVAPVRIGDLVQVFIKLEHEKRGKWSSAKPVLSHDKKSGTVTVPGQNGRTIKAAVEDVRFAITDNELAIKFQEACDVMDTALNESIDSLNEDTPNYVADCASISETEELGPTHELRVGDKIEIYWPLDDQYYPGLVSEYSEATGKHQISYDDGEVENLKMNEETWRILPTNQVTLPKIASIHKEALHKYFKTFAHKEFMLHQAEGLPPHPVWNAYHDEELKFLKTVREVPIQEVPKNSNIITSHVIYKIKANDDGSFKMKARIAPHGNKDKDKESLKTDSSQCPPTGIRILLSIAAIMQWPLAKIDFTSAFLQTGEAKRDVYVVPPRECRRKSFYWLLLTSAYGLVNANAKWQEHCDFLFSTLGLNQSRFVPQLFFASKTTKIDIIAVKIVDDVLITGKRTKVENFISSIKKQYKLGTIVSGPGSFLFNGLQIIQNTDMTIRIHGDGKLESLNCFPIDRRRRKQVSEVLNPIELKAFRSVNSSIGWLGTNASLLCSFYSSWLQQRAPSPTVHDLIYQINALKVLKKYGTSISYIRPEKGDFKLSVLIFADASQQSDHGQLSYLAGLLFGNLESGSVFHTLSWSSHKSQRPVKSVTSAETLAAGEAIDEGKVLAKALEELLGTEVKLWIVVDSKDLFSTLSTCRSATDRSIRGDVSSIRFEFATKNVCSMIWVPGKINLADRGTKPDTQLTQTLQVLFESGCLPINFSDAIVQSSNLSTG